MGLRLKNTLKSDIYIYMVLYCFKCSDFYVIDDIRMLSLQKFGFSMVFLDVFSW